MLTSLTGSWVLAPPAPPPAPALFMRIADTTFSSTRPTVTTPRPAAKAWPSAKLAAGVGLTAASIVQRPADGGGGGERCVAAGAHHSTRGALRLGCRLAAASADQTTAAEPSTTAHPFEGSPSGKQVR